MNLRSQYLIFVVMLHGIFFLLSLQFLPGQPFVFFLMEGLIIISIGFSIKLFRSLIAPVKLISDGVQSIKARDFNTQLTTVGQPEMDQLINVYNRMIEELREERVKQQEQQYFLEKLIQASPAGIIILELDGNIHSINPVASKFLAGNAKRLIGSQLAAIEGNFASQLAQLPPGIIETIVPDGHRAFKCQKSHFLDRGFQRYFILIEELTEELIKREKQTYGKIIRFMSHEISNSIGAINSILNSLLNYQGQINKDDLDDYSGAIDVAISRNDHLNQFMQNYAQIVRLPPPAMEKQDLHELLHSIETLFSGECQKASIAWEWNLDGEKLECEFDLQQIEQALVNIIKNSIEAIGENGKISVTTLNQTHPELRICDSGSGFTKTIQAQLFTPFFSTKKNGQGVGLIMIRDILMNHGFRFSLHQNEDQRTEFLIEF
ncbi:MAG: HAMP domain-containing protein [Candidatus Marinimicrobia bacterium]|nr:HAMP domain-containing protein [Candidatus Neomarinimicrobiota bacterium]